MVKVASAEEKKAMGYCFELGERVREVAKAGCREETVVRA